MEAPHHGVELVIDGRQRDARVANLNDSINGGQLPLELPLMRTRTTRGLVNQ